MKILKTLVLLGSTLNAGLSMATLTLNKVPPEIKLEAKNKTGGLVKGGDWSSKDLVGKVSVLFYVARNAESLNDPASDALKKEEFPSEKFQSFAVVNMAASPGIPNFIISSILKGKQEKHPRTVFVEDKKSVLVTEWNLADKNSDVVAFDKEGKVIFSVDGKLTDEQITELVAAVKNELAEKPAQKFETNQANTNTETKNKKN